MSDTEAEWGLLADGRARDTAVELYEFSGAIDRYEFEIHRPELYLRFRLERARVLIDLALFLQEPSGTELHIGTLGGKALHVVNDPEYPAVFIFRTLHDDGVMLWTLRGDEVKELVIALERAIKFLPH